MYKNPITQIHSYTSNFSKADQKIADFIMKHAEEVGNASIGQLAEKIGVADSSIIRFTQKIGYSGYREFKLALVATYLNHKEKDLYFGDVADNFSSMETILKGLLSGHIQNTQLNMNELNYNQLEEVAELFLEKEHIYFVGSGPSGIAAETGYMLFSNVFKTVHLARDKFSMVQNSMALSENDMIIAISQTGEAEHVTTLVEKAQEQGTTVVALTTSYDSTIYQHADYPIIVPSNQFNSGTRYLVTNILIQMILQSLYIYVETSMKKQEKNHRNWIFDHYRTLL